MGENVRNLLSFHVVTWLFQTPSVLHATVQQSFAASAPFLCQMTNKRSLACVWNHRWIHGSSLVSLPPYMATHFTWHDIARKTESEEGSVNQWKEVHPQEFRGQHFTEEVMSDWRWKKKQRGRGQRQRESVWVGEWVSEWLSETEWLWMMMKESEMEEGRSRTLLGVTTTHHGDEMKRDFSLFVVGNTQTSYSMFFSGCNVNASPCFPKFRPHFL